MITQSKYYVKWPYPRFNNFLAGKAFSRNTDIKHDLMY